MNSTSICTSVLLPESLSGTDDWHNQDGRCMGDLESQSSWSDSSDGEENNLEYYDALSYSFYSVDDFEVRNIDSLRGYS